MALVECKECGNMVSENAIACPSCGNPVEKKRYCPKCGNELTSQDIFCSKCGHRMVPPVHTITPPPVAPVTEQAKQEESPSNGLGKAGMILAIIASVFMMLGINTNEDFFAVIGAIPLILAFIFSLIGIFRKPKATAIVGLALSGVWLSLAIIGIMGEGGMFW